MLINPVRLLSVEDNPGDARLLVELISGVDDQNAVAIGELTTVPSLAQAKIVLEQKSFDLILLDLSLPDSLGLDTVKKMQQLAPEIPIVVMSGIQDDAVGVQAVQAGAQDYLVKGYVDSRGLARAIRYAIERSQSQNALQKERNRAREYEIAATVIGRKNEEAMTISKMAYWDFDVSRQVFIFNQRFYTLHGITDCEHLQMNAATFISRYVHPEYSEQFQHILLNPDQTELAVQIQCQMVRTNGETFWVAIRFRRDIDSDSLFLRGVNQDITELKQAEKALRQSEYYLVTAQRLAHVGYWENDFVQKNIIWSAETYRIFGLEPSDEKQPLDFFWILVHPDDRDALISQWKTSLMNGQKYFESNFRIVPPDGAIRYVHTQGDVEYDEKKRPVRMIGAIQDVSEHIGAQQKIQAALEEKLVLLREVHHRVKNNLQAIISLIEMRIDNLYDPYTIQFLREIQEQARTMSLVYEQLYQSESLARIEMQSYLDKLTSNVIQAFGEGRNIVVEVQAAEIWLDVGAATPCGLIINELLTNALKHAFPPGYQGQPTIQVSFKRNEDHFALVVQDNGVGLPDNLELRQSRSMGLRLVKLWAEHQLGGKFSIQADPTSGAQFMILLNEMRKSIRSQIRV